MVEGGTPGFSDEAIASNFSDSRCWRASSSGPVRVARNFVREVFLLLALADFAIVSVYPTVSERSEEKKKDCLQERKDSREVFFRAVLSEKDGFQSCWVARCSGNADKILYLE